MTRTVAPNVFGGRLCLKLARTTPELPITVQYHDRLKLCYHPIISKKRHTVCPRDLAPDDSDLGALHLTLGTVDERDLLAEVKPACLLAGSFF